MDVAHMKNRDHFAFIYTDELQIGEVISDFVKRGLDYGQINVFFCTVDEAQRFSNSLKRSGVEVDKLLASSEIVIVPIDVLLQEEQFSVITDTVSDHLEVLSNLVRKNGKKGLNIVGRIAGNLAKQGRDQDVLSMEKFWIETVRSSNIPITLLWPYEYLYPTLVPPLQLFDHYSLYSYGWEIIPANFECITCRKKVNNELRIFEPKLMESQSERVTTTMQKADAGWMPYCFKCLSEHPYLKPSWLF
jgi:DcmR-like sensory protein